MGVEEELMCERAHRPDAEQHDETQARKRGYSGCLLVRAGDLKAVLEVVPNPERAVDNAGEEEATPCPALNVVKLAICPGAAEEDC